MVEESRARRVRGLLQVLAGLVPIGLLVAVGEFTPYLYGLRRLALGTANLPRPEAMGFYALWSVFGTASAVLLALGLSDLFCGPLADRISRATRRLQEQHLVLAGATLGFLIPALIRVLVLQEAPLTDDESAYRFSAQLLASGRLVAPSPHHRLFFDRAFMVNDGTWYSQYFLGWPALMSPFVLTGISGYANSVYSALTVPGFYFVCRRLCGARWARLGLLLYVTSPFLMIAAATQMSHTSGFFALTYVFLFLLRTIDHPKQWSQHVGLATFFSIAFFIRPLTALGIGGPALFCWGWRLVRGYTRPRLRAVAAFLVPLIAAAALFFTVNTVQNGSAFKTAYSRAREYVVENDYRFGHLTQPMHRGKDVPNFDFTDPVHGLSVLGAGIFRISFALSGWPCGLTLALLARRRKSVPWLWASVIAFLAAHGLTIHAGVDSFGPVHHLELSLPLLLLTTLGVASASEWLGRVTGDAEGRLRLSRLPVLGVFALILLAVTTYVPIRMACVGAIARNVNIALRAPDHLSLSNAVIFAFRPAVAYCESWPAKGFVFWRPNPRPTLDDDVVWVNHIDVGADRAFLQEVFPGRKGYVMLWTNRCQVRLFDLDEVPDGAIPPADARSSKAPIFRQ